MIRKVLSALLALALTAAIVAATDYTHYTNVMAGNFRASTNTYCAGTDSVGVLLVAGAGTFGGAVTAAGFSSSGATGTNDAFSDTCDFSAPVFFGSAAAVVCSTTVEVQGALTAASTFAVTGTSAFTDSVNFGDDVVATMFTGDLTGDVTGDVAGDLTGDVTGGVAQVVAFAGNLPAAADHDYEIYMNTTGDTVWISNATAWVQLAP